MLLRIDPAAVSSYCRSFNTDENWFSLCNCHLFGNDSSSDNTRNKRFSDNSRHFSWQQEWILHCMFNPLQPGVAFPYPLKTSENLKVLWGFLGRYRKAIAGCNGLMKRSVPSTSRILADLSLPNQEGQKHVRMYWKWFCFKSELSQHFLAQSQQRNTGKSCEIYSQINNENTRTTSMHK